jgi:Rrf2 family transcriptional regulator, iron-sulfur cluster assembly transcription factor
MFSKTTEYALRAVIYIGQKASEEKKLGLTEISAAIGSPQQFTAKILQLLTKNHTVVSSVRGPNGGFFLTEAAKNLPARAIIDAIGESDVLTKCVLGLYQCSESQPCPMHNEYKPIRKQMISLFETKTIRQLAADTENGKVLIIKG